MSELFPIRKWITQLDEEWVREGRASDVPLRRVVVAAVIHNPYAGMYQEDLSEAVDYSETLGAMFGQRVADALDGAVESYGKGGIAGVSGSQEHVGMFVTTRFANPLRAAIGGGIAWMSSASIVASAGTPLTLPLAHKDALYVRDNYDAITLYPGDAPRPDEVVVAVSAANRGRLNARLGGLSVDEVVGEDGLR